jgi:hypothetical protein
MDKRAFLALAGAIYAWVMRVRTIVVRWPWIGG